MLTKISVSFAVFPLLIVSLKSGVSQNGKIHRWVKKWKKIDANPMLAYPCFEQLGPLTALQNMASVRDSGHHTNC